MIYHFKLAYCLGHLARGTLCGFNLKNLASMFSSCSLIIGPKNIHCLPEVKQIGCFDLEDVGSMAGKHRRGQVAGVWCFSAILRWDILFVWPKPDSALIMVQTHNGWPSFFEFPLLTSAHMYSYSFSKCSKRSLHWGFFFFQTLKAR